MQPRSPRMGLRQIRRACGYIFFLGNHKCIHCLGCSSYHGPRDTCQGGSQYLYLTSTPMREFPILHLPRNSMSGRGNMRRTTWSLRRRVLSWKRVLSRSKLTPTAYTERAQGGTQRTVPVQVKVDTNCIHRTCTWRHSTQCRNGRHEAHPDEPASELWFPPASALALALVC